VEAPETSFACHRKSEHAYSRLIPAIAIVAFSLLATSQASASPADVLSTEVLLNNAILAHDAATAGQYLTEDYTLTLASGKVLDRAALLAIVADRSVTLTTNRAHDEHVRMYGDATAIITGIVEEAGTQNGSPFDIQLPFTDTWVLQNGKWLQAAGHASTPTKV
jgi:hypothetical protein